MLYRAKVPWPSNGPCEQDKSHLAEGKCQELLKFSEMRTSQFHAIWHCRKWGFKRFAFPHLRKVKFGGPLISRQKAGQGSKSRLRWKASFPGALQPLPEKGPKGIGFSANPEPATGKKSISEVRKSLWGNRIAVFPGKSLFRVKIFFTYLNFRPFF